MEAMNEVRLKVVTVAIIEDGCFSALCWDGKPFAVSLERTFQELYVVIPAGVHKCTATTFHRGGYATFEIEVEGHKRVLFHKGNWEGDSEGCMLIGEEYGTLHDKPAIIHSGQGFTELMRLAEGLTEFYMQVTGR